METRPPDSGVPRVDLTLSLDPFLALPARSVLFHAKDQGKALGHGYVGTEHVLLGLLCEREGVAAKVLDELGVRLGAAQLEVERAVGRGQSVLGPLGYSPRAQRLMELSLHEAVGMGRTLINTEHILLSMQRLGEGTAVRVLQQLDVSVPDIRKAVVAYMEGLGETVGSEAVEAAEPPVQGMPAGEILVRQGVITKEQLSLALEQARRSDELIGRTLVNLGLIDESELVRALALQVGLEFVDFSEASVDPEAAKLLPPAVAWRHLALPIAEREGKLVVAMLNSANSQLVEDIELVTDRKVQPVIATPSDLIRAIREHLGPPETDGSPGH